MVNLCCVAYQNQRKEKRISRFKKQLHTIWFCDYHMVRIADYMGRLKGKAAIRFSVQRQLLFLSALPGEIAQLKNRVVVGDARLVEQKAHKIKGACATVGGKALRAVAWAMEQAGKAGDMDAARALVTDLDAQFNALRKVLKNDR